MKKMKKLSRLIALPLLAVVLSFAPAYSAYAAQVAVTVEKLTLNGGFIVEPTLITLSGEQSAANVTTALLSSKFPGIKAYSSGGSGSSFYLKGVYDPSRGGLLSEFSEGNKSGWMITVNNRFIRTSAGFHTLYDGDVVRWQYTKQLGRDLGEDVEHLGTNTLANKDALVWKVAEINTKGNKLSYGSAYNAAVSVLKNLNASQSEVNAALTALVPSGGSDTGTDNSGGTNTDTGGGSNAGTDTGSNSGGSSNTGTDTNGGTDTGSNSGGSSNTGTDTSAGTDTGGNSGGSSNTGTDTSGGTDTGSNSGGSSNTGTDTGGGMDTGTTPGGSTPSGTTPGANAEIIATPPVAPPSGVEKGIGTHTAASSELKELGYEGSIAVKADGSVTFSEETFRNAPGSAALMDEQKPVTPLPVFRTGVTAGGTALVALKLSLDGYAGETLGSIAVLKMTFGGSVEKLDMAASSERLVSGSYVWTDAAGNAIPSSNKAVSGRNYYISVAIGDDSDYDLDGKPGTIVDPLALAVESTKTESENNNNNNTGSSGGGGGSSGGGGGCDAGAFGIFAPFALAALAFAETRRKR